MSVLTFDVETSTKNKGNPFTASGKMVSYGVKVDDEECTFHYYTDIDFAGVLREAIRSAKLLVGFNLKFDLHWARRYGSMPSDRVRVWDCQIAEFIIRGQQGAYPSLNECLTKYGLGQKDDKIAEYWDLGVDTEFIPVDELKFYNNLDVELTYKLYLAQLEVMSDKQKRLCYLMGLDLLVLAEMEWNGIKFDIELCKEKAVEAEQQLKDLNEEILIFSPYPDINLDSGQHLSCLLFGGVLEIEVATPTERVYKSGPNKGLTYTRNSYHTERYEFPRLFNPLPRTEAKLKMKLSDGSEQPWYTTNEQVLKQLKAPTKQHKRLIEALLERAEVGKLVDTYYGKLPQLLETMEWGDILHGQYNQVVAATGRLSSSNPNMQNFSGDVDKLLVSRYD
jgi:DNA polymerase I-like protein with 3'-5' exonuclease and polymerase domains